MAFFPANYGESRAFTSPRSGNEEHTQTWRDVQGLDEIHQQERMKDEERHKIYLMKEKEMKKKQQEKQRYMNTHVERLERSNPGPAINVPPQYEPSRAQDPTLNRPGIGLLGEGEKSDYDVYDTHFHGGKNKSKTNKKKSRTNKKKSRTNKKKSRINKKKSRSKKSRTNKSKTR
jgi:hypothetical protein